MMPGGFEYRRRVLIGCLIADDVKQGDDRIE